MGVDKIMLNAEMTSIITIEELCEQLMIGRNMAYKLLASGKIKAFRIGKTWKIPQQAVSDYVFNSCQ